MLQYCSLDKNELKIFRSVSCEIINLNNSLRSDLIQVCKNNSVNKNEIKFIYNLSDDKLGEEGIFRKRHLSKRGRIYESATENQKRDWIGKKHADEFEIVKV